MLKLENVYNYFIQDCLRQWRWCSILLFQTKNTIFGANWQENKPRCKKVTSRSIGPELLHKNSVFKNFAIFFEKNQCCRPYITKVARCRATCNFIKEKLQHSSFLVLLWNLRPTFLQNTSGRLLLYMNKCEL